MDECVPLEHSLQSREGLVATVPYDHDDAEPAAQLHRGEHVAHAQEHLREFVASMIAEAVEAGDIRTDLPATELANYAVHALAAARTLSSKAAVQRLVAVTLQSLRGGDVVRVAGRSS